MLLKVWRRLVPTNSAIRKGCSKCIAIAGAIWEVLPLQVSDVHAERLKTALPGIQSRATACGYCVCHTGAIHLHQRSPYVKLA